MIKLRLLLLLAVCTLGLLCADDDLIRVAVFKGEGVGQSYRQLIKSLEKEKKTFQISRIKTAGIIEG